MRKEEEIYLKFSNDEHSDGDSYDYNEIEGDELD